MVSQSELLGRLVRASWQAADAQPGEETCVVVEDHPAEVILFPLAAGDDLPTASPQHLALLACHPWAFPAAKAVLAEALWFFAKGREYRLVGAAGESAECRESCCFRRQSCS